MTGVFFLDSSALIKLYHNEPGTERVDHLFAATDTTLVISELTAVEMYSALARKVRTGEITADGLTFSRRAPAGGLLSRPRAWGGPICLCR